MKIKNTVFKTLAFFLMQTPNILSASNIIDLWLQNKIGATRRPYSIHIESDSEGVNQDEDYLTQYTVTISNDKKLKKNDLILGEEIQRRILEDHLKEHHYIKGVDIRGISLEGLEEYDFDHCKLDNDQVKWMILNKGSLERASLYKSELNLDDFNHDLQDISFFDTSLTLDQALHLIEKGANIKKSQITKSPFKNKNLQRLNFQGITFTGVDFRDADLTDTDFKDSYICGCNFSKAKLLRSNFTKSEIIISQFSGADLTNADFTDAYILSPNFEGAELTSANFTRVKSNDHKLLKNSTGKLESIKHHARSYIKMIF